MELDRATIQDRVITVLAEAAVLPREDVADLRTNLREDIGMDSMDYVELITVLERELGRQVEREELAFIRTVGDLVDLVCRLAGLPDAAGVSGDGHRGQPLGDGSGRERRLLLEDAEVVGEHRPADVGALPGRLDGGVQ